MRGHPPTLRSIEGGLSDVPEPPERMTHPVARAEWTVVAEALTKAGLLEDAALATLENYCQAIAGARDCEKIIAEQGRFVTVPSGVPKLHPAVRAHQNYLDIARQYAGEIGLTATSKNRIKPNKGTGQGNGAPAGLDL